MALGLVVIAAALIGALGMKRPEPVAAAMDDHVVNLNGDRDTAKLAAESLADATAEKLFHDPMYGTHRETVAQASRGEGGSAFLSFDPGQGKEFCVNNVAGNVAVAGCRGRVVPAHSVQLVVRGTCNQSSVVVEEILERGTDGLLKRKMEQVR